MAEQMTQAGYDELQKELNELITVRRKEVAERLKEAISYGDISENSEYDAAKEEQANLEERIGEIQIQLRDAVVIKDEDISSDTVGVGTTVKLKDMVDNKEVTYEIVGDTESDPFEGKLSSECIVGRNLLGRKKGDKVHFTVPSGEAKYQILDIKKSK